LLPETGCEAVIPIALRGEVLGVLGVQGRENAGISAEAINLLESIASQIAFALRNANTYQATQQHVQQETVASQISQQIRQTTNRKKAIQVATRELGRSLKTPQTMIQLRDNHDTTQK
jgi:GAF domain-containing protein